MTTIHLDITPDMTPQQKDAALVRAFTELLTSGDLDDIVIDRALQLGCVPPPAQAPELHTMVRTIAAKGARWDGPPFKFAVNT